MNREKLFKFVKLWMDAAMAETMDEEDGFLDQMDPIWYEFNEEEITLIRKTIQPFMHETYWSKEDRELFKSFNKKSTTGETNHD